VWRCGSTRLVGGEVDHPGSSEVVGHMLCPCLRGCNLNLFPDELNVPFGLWDGVSFGAYPKNL